MRRANYTSNRTIRVLIHKQPDLYEELTAAMLGHGQYEGCYVEQYTEYHEDGQTIAKFTLRESEGSGEHVIHD